MLSPVHWSRPGVIFLWLLWQNISISSHIGKWCFNCICLSNVQVLAVSWSSEHPYVPGVDNDITSSLNTRVIHYTTNILITSVLLLTEGPVLLSVHVFYFLSSSSGMSWTIWNLLCLFWGPPRGFWEQGNKAIYFTLISGEQGNKSLKLKRKGEQRQFWGIFGKREHSISGVLFWGTKFGFGSFLS